MTRILPALLALLSAAAPAAAADRPWPVADFDRLVIEGPYRVHLVVGRPSRAVASGTRTGLDRISIESSGTTLRIRPARGVWGAAAGADPGIVTVELGTRTLRSVRLLGPARLDVEGSGASTDRLTLDLMVEGSGTLRATGVAVDALTLGLQGSGSLEVAGTTHNLRGQFQGTGNVNASALAADAATVTANTVGTVALQVNGRAEITAYGLGEVNVTGNPACVVTGSSRAQVRCGTSDQRQNR